MTACIQTAAFGRTLEPRERRWRLPRPALRRRSADHPMVMFALVAGIAFVAMTISASSHPPRPAESPTAPVAASTDGQPAPAGGADVACKGQAWGAEDEACLRSILRSDDQLKDRVVRKLAAA